MRHSEAMKLHASMKNHQITSKGIIGFGQLVSMVSNEDNPCVAPGAVGVLVILEQGTMLGISVAVFHHLKDDGSLGPPCRVKKPVFTSGHL